MKYLLAAILSLFAATAAVTADTPRQGGTMVYMSGKIPSFDPLHGQYNVGLVSSNIFASLTRLNENNEVSPYLAESYSVSDDGLTYTFNLARNAKFHDGRARDRRRRRVLARHHPRAAPLRAPEVRTDRDHRDAGTTIP